MNQGLRFSETEHSIELHFDETEVEFTFGEFRYFLDCINNLNNFPLYKEWKNASRL